MATAATFIDRFSLLEHTMGARRRPGLVMEFGVFEGETLRFIADRCGDVVHGFDSFEGLPADWRPGFPRGSFACAPLQPHPHQTEIHVGLFERSLPRFLARHRASISFLHIDCDLYESTRTIFCLCGDRIVRNTVIVFDEFWGFPGWQHHEFRAFTEFLIDQRRACELLGRVRGGEQAAFVMRN
ncbi:class I SAM-dependent methyltransferase [Caballeronia sp. GAFFF1]|uniref:class I SAM-dependent methyltransferase n=1 Tax=Caballeronia sp. GAFFF1 TaxID=2921779 RepID=UPI002027CC24|nr:class I SAM-dependent methyltransferase [Caballeronia sp. GAFFF1]